MTEKSPGYWQAIENLAWAIRRHSDETQVGILTEHPELLITPELAVDVCRANMTKEQRETWDKIGEIFEQIAKTYHIEDFEEMERDISTLVMEQDVKEMGLLC